MWTATRQWVYISIRVILLILWFLMYIENVFIKFRRQENRSILFCGYVLNSFLFYKSQMSRHMTKPTKWHVRPAKTQISLGIRPVWSEPSLSAWRNIGSLATHWAHSEDSDQTGRIVILLVLSWGGSNIYLLRSSKSTGKLLLSCVVELHGSAIIVEKPAKRVHFRCKKLYVNKHVVCLCVFCSNADVVYVEYIHIPFAF